MSGVHQKLPKKAPEKAGTHPALSRETGGPVVQRTPAPGYFPGGPAVRIAQPKAAIGPPNDAFEREADAVADRVAAGQKAGSISRMGTGIQKAAQQPGAQPAATDDKLVQKQAQTDDTSGAKQVRTDDMPVQKKAADEEQPVQTKVGPGGPSGANVAANAIASKGPGAPLSPKARSALEPAFGADLGHVRVHEDPGARQAARALNARAFTHGSDIWLGPGESQSDRRLMAHETAHTFQQGGVVRRLPTEPNPIRELGDFLVFDNLPMPAWKVPLHPGRLVHPKNYSRPPSEPRTFWQNQSAHVTTARTILENKVLAAHGVDPSVDPPAAERLKRRAATFRVPGDRVIGPNRIATIARELALPNWGRDGTTMVEYQVDHRKELQLGGRDNVVTNMWMVKGSINGSSGSRIMHAIRAKAREYLWEKHPGGVADMEAEVDLVKQNWRMAFNRAVPLTSVGMEDGPQPGALDIWETTEIAAGTHLAPVTPVLDAASGATNATIYFGSSSRFGVPMDMTTAVASDHEHQLVKPFQIREKHFPGVTVTPPTPGAAGTSTTPAAPAAAAGGPNLGTLKLRVQNADKHWEDMPGTAAPLPVVRRSATTGYIDTNSLGGLRVKYKHLSPVEITRMEGTQRGMNFAGRITPTLPLLRNTPIDFEANGDDITISKTFATDSLQVPPPFRISEASLRVYASRNDFGAQGRVNFGVQSLGQGYLQARGTLREGISLTGSFDFDSRLFTRSNITLTYAGGELSARGTANIGPGKLAGIRSADLSVSMQRGVFEARGTIVPAIPAIQQGDVTVRYAESEGLTLGAGLQLARVPGIRSGRVDLSVRRSDQGYRLTASGSAQPAIPGINSELSIAYDDGALTVGGNAAYQRGMLAGTVQVGATNRPLDPEGNPTEGPPGQTMRLYGSGELSLRLAPWLQATARVRLLPNGEIVVTGRVGLPSSLDIFPQKAINKNIFTTPPLDIPIIGVAAAGRRIGIFATLSGGLDARAGIGPGQLRELSLEVTYNPAREADTTVRGRAQLHIPAHAGLRLFIRGGLGAGIPLVNAEAGLEVGGELGLEGAAQAGVQVDWSPRQGLRLEAMGEIYVQPKFRFDISGYVRVSLDLLLTTIELYSKRWQLAQFEYGSNLRFGVRFPVRYQEGQPFDIRLSDVQFQTPDISVREMVSGLLGRLA